MDSAGPLRVRPGLDLFGFDAVCSPGETKNKPCLLTQGREGRTNSNPFLSMRGLLILSILKERPLCANVHLTTPLLSQLTPLVNTVNIPLLTQLTPPVELVNIFIVRILIGCTLMAVYTSRMFRFC
jgi:hypothetical protein